MRIYTKIAWLPVDFYQFITSNDVKRGFDQFKLRRFNTTDFIILLVGIGSHPLGISRAPMHFSTFSGWKVVVIPAQL